MFSRAARALSLLIELYRIEIAEDYGELLQNPRLLIELYRIEIGSDLQKANHKYAFNRTL